MLAGDQILAEDELAAGGAMVEATLLPQDGGELFWLYGDSGLLLPEGGGDLLPPLGVPVDILGRGLAVSLPFCCCLHFARLFLNQT